MMDTVFDIFLSALILLTALAAIAGRQLFGAVAFFLVFGVMVAIAWIRLEAIDVAIAEAAIGAGLTGVLLLGAVARMRQLAPEDVAPGPVWLRAVTALAAAGVSAGIGWAVLTLPPTSGMQPEVGLRISQAGAENPVTAVLLNFRAWDTMLESIVLLAAVLAVWSLTKDHVWGGVAGRSAPVPRDEVLAGFARALPPIGLLTGVYLVWAGGTQPGGAFQGGTVLAAVLLLAIAAGQLPAPSVGSGRVRFLLVLGPAVFLAVALAGAVGGQFLLLPADHAKTLILLIEAALTVSITLTLVLLLLGAPETEASS